MPTEDESTGVCHALENAAHDPVWWLGFDCGHGMDITPSWSKILTEHLCGGIYRDFQYVQEQVTQLAGQLIAENCSNQAIK
jgi:hypothetical protein